MRPKDLVQSERRRLVLLSTSEGNSYNHTAPLEKPKQLETSTTSTMQAESQRSTASTPSEVSFMPSDLKSDAADAPPHTLADSVGALHISANLNANNKQPELFSDEDLSTCIDKLEKPLRQEIQTLKAEHRELREKLEAYRRQGRELLSQFMKAVEKRRQG